MAAKKDAHIYYLGVAKAEYRSCELANPAQVRQIASQTGVLFSAGRGLLLAGTPWRSCWYGQPAKAAGQGAVAELLVRAASGSSWRERCGGMERSGSLCGKACRWASDDAAASRKSLPLGGRLCGCIVEKLAAGRATPLRQREGAEQHREGAEQHREEAQWQQSALYSIFIPVPQAPYCHSYHNKIQKGRVILRYRE